MYLEERIDQLEKQINKMNREIERLNRKSTDEILTPKEFAQRAKLNENTVYCWIRAGKIKIIPGLGTALRIPMSQFYDAKEIPGKMTKSEELKKEFLEIVKSRI